MSRIKTSTILKLEDVPSDNRPWMAKVIQPVNDFLIQATKILNGGVLFSDQIIGKDVEFDFTYSASTLPLKYTWPLKLRPKTLFVASAYQDNVAFVCGVAWDYDGTSILLTDIKNNAAALTSGAKYSIVVRITP